MSSTTRHATKRGLDFYATPAWVTKAILPHLPVGHVLDPACGEGAILDAAREVWGRHPSQNVALEIDAARAEVARAKGYRVQVRDALGPEPLGFGPGVTCIMNPPFGQAQGFVERALLEAKPDGCTVAALLRLAFLEGIARASFHREHRADVFVLAKRPSFRGGGTDSTAYAWFVWGPGRGGRWSILGGA